MTKTNMALNATIPVLTFPPMHAHRRRVSKRISLRDLFTEVIVMATIPMRNMLEKMKVGDARYFAGKKLNRLLPKAKTKRFS
jgi:hypothetical protein